jgi:hypothetical protein
MIVFLIVYFSYPIGPPPPTPVQTSQVRWVGFKYRFIYYWAWLHVDFIFVMYSNFHVGKKNVRKDDSIEIHI